MELNLTHISPAELTCFPRENNLPTQTQPGVKVTISDFLLAQNVNLTGAHESCAVFLEPSLHDCYSRDRLPTVNSPREGGGLDQLGERPQEGGIKNKLIQGGKHLQTSDSFSAGRGERVGCAVLERFSHSSRLSLLFVGCSSYLDESADC